MHRFGIALLLSLLTAGAQQLETFDAVWKTVADKHWNPKQLEALPGGGSWQALREPYRARVAAAQSQSEVRTILREMIAQLGKSHYAIQGVEFDVNQKARKGGGTSPGFRIGDVEGKLVVTNRDAGVTAVQLGWELLAVEGTPLVKTLPAKESLQSSLRLHQSLQNQISGSGGETLDYEFRLPTGAKRTIPMAIPKADGSAGFGFVQGINVKREFALLGAKRDIGYFRLDMFLDVIRVLPEFEKAIGQCAKCRGFVIDLRGNPGGVAVMANALAGWFISGDGTKLGTMYQRDVELKFVVIPRLNGFSGPLAILVDGASASTSEIFAGGMKDIGRARIFGTRTAGAALPSIIELLPNGDLFQYAVANYVSESGKELEGAGVQPDVTVKYTLASLRAGKDLPLDTALDWIYASPAVNGTRP